MKNLLKKSIVGAAIALAYSSGAFADATLSNGSITAVINDGGSFGVAPVYAGGTPGLSYNGVEFVNIDNPSSWWTLRSDDNSFNLTSQYNSNPLGSTTFQVGPQASTTLAFGGLSFVQTAALTAANQISYQVSFTNNGSALTHLKYGVGIDPDQGGSGKNTTFNNILGQGTGASVSAADTLYGSNLKVTLANTTTAFPSAIAAYINTASCCAVVAPSSALGSPEAVGFNTLADHSISLAYDIGSIGTGQTVSLGYSYTFAPIPEPETYAMLLAGLGLMGVVARRRKQQSGAV